MPGRFYLIPDVFELAVFGGVAQPDPAPSRRSIQLGQLAYGRQKKPPVGCFGLRLMAFLRRRGQRCGLDAALNVIRRARCLPPLRDRHDLLQDRMSLSDCLRGP